MRLRIIAPLFLILLFIFMGVFSARMYVPVAIEQKTLHDITPIKEPEAAQSFFGHLDGFPHTYEIRSIKPFSLFTEIRVPDNGESKNRLSVIVIKETGERGRVKEVARILATDGAWESHFEPWTGDKYRKGGTYHADLESGIYRIEVSTPDNLEPYVLMVGENTSILSIGYFERIKQIARMKVFMGKSWISSVESPLVYIPLIFLLSSLFGYVIYRRRCDSTEESS